MTMTIQTFAHGVTVEWDKHEGFIVRVQGWAFRRCYATKEDALRAAKRTVAQLTGEQS